MAEYFDAFSQGFTRVSGRTDRPGDESSRTWLSNYRPTRVKVLNKPSITKNPVINGWRKPSPYWCYGSQLVPMRGTFEASILSPLVVWDRGSFRHTRDISLVGDLGRQGVGASRFTSLASSSTALPNANLIHDEFQNRSIIAARNAIADRRAAFGESLAELRSGMEDLGTLMRKNATIFKGIVSRNPRQVLSAFKGTRVKPSKAQTRTVKRIIGNKTRGAVQHTAESLIALEWGISPLIEDMHLLAQNLEGTLLAGGLRVNGKGTAYTDDNQSMPGKYIDLGQEFRADTITHRRTRKGVYTSLWYDIELPSIRTLTKLGLTDVPQVMWAIVPGSFAVDWVIPISTWLKSLTATMGLKYTGGTSTAFYRADDVTVAKPPYKLGGFAAWSGHPRLQVTPEIRRHFRIDRQVHGGEPIPHPPSVRDPFGAYQVTMSAAILLGSIKTLPVERSRAPKRRR